MDKTTIDKLVNKLVAQALYVHSASGRKMSYGLFNAGRAGNIYASFRSLPRQPNGFRTAHRAFVRN